MLKSHKTKLKSNATNLSSDILSVSSSNTLAAVFWIVQVQYIKAENCPKTSGTHSLSLPAC